MSATVARLARLATPKAHGSNAARSGVHAEFGQTAASSGAGYARFVSAGLRHGRADARAAAPKHGGAPKALTEVLNAPLSGTRSTTSSQRDSTAHHTGPSG